MNEPIDARLNQLNDEAIGVSDEVSAAIDAGDDQRQLAAGKMVADLAQQYAALIADVSEEDRQRVDRSLGRRITDLRRQAQQLTRRMGGTKAPASRDAGFVPFLEQRAPPKSIVPQRAAPNRHAPQFTVGGEVEGWCGKCRDFTLHHVVALMGDKPKQVICTKCKSRHGYRTEPTTRGAQESNGPPSQTQSATVYRTPVDPEVTRRAEQKQKLIKELDEATEPRTFDPRGRYKANEIIVHPEFGRGKIENVLKGSMLVRFREGLKPLNMK